MLTQRFFRPRGTCVATKTGPSAKALGYFQQRRTATVLLNLL
jgi:hypothetical protein